MPKQTVQTRQATERDYERELALTCDLLAKLAEGVDTWDEIAKASGLCWQTVYNLLNGVTKRPQFRTVFLTGLALGVHVGCEKNRIKLRLAG